MQSPTPREEQPWVPAQVGAQLAGKQLCGAGPEGPGGQQTVHEPAVPLWPGRPAQSWDASGRALPEGQGR